MHVRNASFLQLFIDQFDGLVTDDDDNTQGIHTDISRTCSFCVEFRANRLDITWCFDVDRTAAVE
jgi:hypothetical protein